MSAHATIAVLDDLRFQRDVEWLHHLGPRAIDELLCELAAERMIRSEIERKVTRYARLDPAILKAIGGDRFPPRPLHIVGGDL